MKNYTIDEKMILLEGLNELILHHYEKMEGANTQDDNNELSVKLSAAKELRSKLSFETEREYADVKRISVQVDSLPF